MVPARARARLTFAADGNNNVIYWSSSDSTPIEDIKLMKQAVQLRTGRRPNVLVISRPIFDTLTEHPGYRRSPQPGPDYRSGAGEPR